MSAGIILDSESNVLTNKTTQFKTLPSETVGRTTHEAHQSELLETRVFLVTNPDAISFEECKTDDGTIITVNEIIEPSNVTLPTTKYRSSIDISRLISRGDYVWKVNEQQIEPKHSLTDFQRILQDEYQKHSNQPISISILKTSQKQHGSLASAPTIRNALKWKSDQEAKYVDPRNVLKRRLDSIFVQVFIFLLIILDITLFAVAESHGDNKDDSWHETFAVITFVILGIYTTEIVLRVYAMRPSVFFRDPLEVLDFVVVLVSLILNLVHFAQAAVFVQAARSVRAFRFIRLARGFRLCVRTTKTLRNAPRSIRQVVRLNKQGYRDDEFDLDLCYITAHVIAMSLPSTGFEMVYRNPISDVAKFMDQHHGTHYMIFDLCLERSYDHSIFHDCVIHYKFQDHGVPTISNMFKLCNGISEWLDRHEDNCVAVHCKGGKGRTGTMICAWLLYRYPDATPDEAIELFATMRTNQIKSDKYQGIETYSQRRYVEYYYQFIKNPQLLVTPPFQCIKINCITVGPLYNKSQSNGSKINLKEDDKEEAANLMASDLMATEWVARIVQRNESSEDTDRVYTFAVGEVNDIQNTITFVKDAEHETLCGNICVMIVKKVNPEPIVFASFWIHTYFLEFDADDNKQEMIVPKLECDKLHKDKKDVKAPHDMAIKLDFDTFLNDDFQ